MWKIFTSPLAGIIGSAASLLLAGWFLATVVTKNNQIEDLEASLKKANEDNEVLRTDNSTLRSNAVALDYGLRLCNTSVQNAAELAGKLTAAGEAAVAEVQKAGASVAKKSAAIDKMPTATCEDALAILKAGGN